MKRVNAKLSTRVQIRLDPAEDQEEVCQKSGPAELQLGLSVNAQQSNGLAKLAGGWSQAEFDEFERNTAAFAEIDSGIWQ